MAGRLPLLLPVAGTLIVLWAVDPALILRHSTPAGGDLHGHLYPVWLMREYFLPSGRLSGWGQGWFAGFPAFSLYFPLPASVAVALSLFVPLPVALKIVTVAGMLALPAATYLLVRSLRLSVWAAGVASLGACAFLFMTSYSILGGNILSSLAGEYAYSWALAGVVLYLALLLRRANEPPPFEALPGTMLAATALSHILGCIVAVTASLTLLGIPSLRRRVVQSWVVGFLLSAFWSLPFLLDQSYRGEVHWQVQRTLLEVLPAELWFWAPAGIVGFLILGAGREGGRRVLGALVGLAVLVYLLPGVPFHPGRLLPYAFWAIHVLGGLAVGSVLELAWIRRSVPRALAGAALLSLPVAMLGLRSHTPVHEVVQEVFRGVESREEWGDFQAVMNALAKHPGTRVFAEDSESLAEVGSMYAFYLTPYWTGGRAASLAGLWQESALGNAFINRMKGSVSPAPYVFSTRAHPGPLNFELGVRQMQLFGVTHYVAVTPAGAELADAHPELTLVEEAGRFRVYELGHPELVAVAEQVPYVFDGAGWNEAIQRWFDEPSRWSQWVIAGDVSDWPRGSGEADLVQSGSVPPESPVVWDLTADRERIAFRTRAVGVPHLVRTSYFPNWRVEGAVGPFLAAPSFMVVVPQQETVVLRFSRSWREWTGLVLTVGALMLLAGMRLRRFEPWRVYRRLFSLSPASSVSPSCLR